MRSHHLGRGPLGALVPALAAIGALWAAPAHAHFILQAPACYSQQNGLGLPLKSAPCGQDDPGMPVMETGMVTTYHPGDTVTITVNEVIAHPGHYRVSLAPDQASLPADPPVTAASTPCGSTVIDSNPKLPVLADGLLVHTTAFTSPQTVQVKLPENPGCTNCVLQVTEFMSNHGLNIPGGCFYHHCANIKIADATDLGTSPPDLASPPPPPPPAPDLSPAPPPPHTGCAASAGGVPAGAAAFAFAATLLLAALGRRRARATRG